ncbi:MAG TPA: acyltransferase [Acidimicrobiia bacterium]|jgi:fucose 4-O-acetylase-like acetyltransferase
MSFFASIQRLADATPPERNRVIDLLRAASILVVVFGHWLMAAVTVDGGELIPGHLLILADWTHPLTWVFQVMPVFFLVGGYANGLSWRSARRRGEGYGSWLRARLRRLALPVVPLLLFWTAGGWLGLQLGLNWEVLQLASQVALVPTWFLAAYVVIVTIAPIGLWVWERWGWWSITTGIALAGLCDYLSIALGVIPVGFLNYVLVWGTVHQIGYAWLDGTIEELWKRGLMAAVGLIGTLLLVGLGPYPVAMVGLDTSEITNSYPPRVTLAFLGMFQAGLALMAEKPLQRLMQRKGAWTFVVGVSARIMTLYLWHLTAMVIVIGLSLAAGGFGLGAEPLGGVWWLTRPVWFLVLGVVTIGLVAVFGRFETPVSDLRPAPPWWRPVVAVLGICAGLGLLAAIGIADDDGLNGLVLSLPIIGVVLGGVSRIPGRVRAIVGG